MLSPLKQLLGLPVAGQPNAIQFEQFVRSLAGSASSSVRQRMGSSIAGMGISEARGYIRARARRAVVHQSSNCFGSNTDIAATTVDRIVERAIDLVTLHMTRELMTQPVEALALSTDSKSGTNLAEASNQAA